MATMLTDDELEDYKKDSLKSHTVNLTLDITATALRRVRAGFNPDQLMEVGQLKVLAAALITMCEKLRDREKPMLPSQNEQENIPASKLWDAIDEGARDAAIAITNVETACMYAVKAATAVPYASKNVRPRTT
jgi:hypothetical protein